MPLPDVTALLRAWGEGDAAALERPMPLVYEELHRRAAGQLKRERPGHTLQPTALVHEGHTRRRPWQIDSAGYQHTGSG